MELKFNFSLQTLLWACNGFSKFFRDQLKSTSCCAKREEVHFDCGKMANWNFYRCAIGSEGLDCSKISNRCREFLSCAVWASTLEYLPFNSRFWCQEWHRKVLLFSCMPPWPRMPYTHHRSTEREYNSPLNLLVLSRHVYPKYIDYDLLQRVRCWWGQLKG